MVLLATASAIQLFLASAASFSPVPDVGVGEVTAYGTDHKALGTCQALTVGDFLVMPSFVVLGACAVETADGRGVNKLGVVDATDDVAVVAERPKAGGALAAAEVALSSELLGQEVSSRSIRDGTSKLEARVVAVLHSGPSLRLLLERSAGDLASGMPLFDRTGRFAGIVVEPVALAEQGEGRFVALPAEAVKELLERASKSGVAQLSGASSVQDQEVCKTFLMSRDEAEIVRDVERIGETGQDVSRSVQAGLRVRLIGAAVRAGSKQLALRLTGEGAGCDDELGCRLAIARASLLCILEGNHDALESLARADSRFTWVRPSCELFLAQCASTDPQVLSWLSSVRRTWPSDPSPCRLILSLKHVPDEGANGFREVADDLVKNDWRLSSGLLAIDKALDRKYAADAERYIEVCLGRHPTSKELKMRAARLHLLRGERQRALDGLRELVKDDPRWEAAWTDLWLTEVEVEGDEKAAQTMVAWRKAAASPASFATPFKWYMSRGRTSEALRCVEPVPAELMRNPDFRALFLTALHAEGRDHQAWEIASESLAWKEGSESLWLVTAALAEDGKHYPECVAACKRVFESDSLNPPALQMTARSLREMGRLKQANDVMDVLKTVDRARYEELVAQWGGH